MHLSEEANNNANQYIAFVNLLLTGKEDRKAMADMMGMTRNAHNMNFIYIPRVKTMDLNRLIEESIVYEKYILSSM